MFTFNKDVTATNCEPGVTRKILCYSDDLMMCEITFKKGAKGNHGHNGGNLDGGEPEFHFAKNAHLGKVNGINEKKEKCRGLPRLYTREPVLHVHGHGSEFRHAHQHV